MVNKKYFIFLLVGIIFFGFFADVKADNISWPWQRYCGGTCITEEPPDITLSDVAPGTQVCVTTIPQGNSGGDCHVSSYRIGNSSPVDVPSCTTAPAGASAVTVILRIWSGTMANRGRCPNYNGYSGCVRSNCMVTPGAITYTRYSGYILSVTKAGDGSGTVTGAGTYNYNTLVTVTATPNATSTFAGWSGDCASFGTNLSGQVTMTSAKTCTATFNILAGTRCTDGTVYVTPTLRTTESDAGSMTWGVGGVRTGAMGIRDGQGNTNDLAARGSEYEAAYYCKNTERTGGYTDWYLPARDELKALHSNKVVIGNFNISGSWPGSYYWSSTELNDYAALLQNFKDGDQTGSFKPYPRSVRCVRTPSSDPTEVCSNVLPTVKLSSNPPSILAGASSTLTWNVANVTSCTATTATEETLHWKNSDLATSTGAHTWDTGILNTVGTSTYGIICSGPGGSASATTTVSVGPAPMPTVTLFSNPSSILVGTSSDLTWNVTKATSCLSTGTETLWAGSTTLATSTGSWPTGIFNTVGTHTYGITCIGLGGTASATTTVTVNIDNIAGPVVTSGGANPAKCQAVDVSWDEYPGADNYDVMRVGGSCVDGTCSLNTSSLSGTIGGLAPNISYSFIINAYRSRVKIATVTTGPVTSGGDCAGPTGSCSILKSPTSSNVNHTTTWTASSTPSCIGCTYTWSGTDINSSLSTTLNTFPKIYTTVGSKDISVEIENPNSSPFCSASGTTTVSFTGGTTEER
jgi:hypothetical protein